MKSVRSGENVVSTLKIPGWRGKWKLQGEQAFRKALVPGSPDFIEGSFVFRPLRNLAPLYIDIDLEFIGRPDDDVENKLMTFSLTLTFIHVPPPASISLTLACFNAPSL